MPGKSDRDSLPKLNDPKNYLSWEPTTTAYLITKRLYKAVNPAVPIPSGVVARNKWDDANMEAYGEIFLLLGERMRDMVTELQTTDGRYLWAWLRDYCLKNNSSSRMSTRKAFYDLKHDPLHPISTYITALRSIVRQLKNFGCEPQPDEISDKLLSALDNVYGPIRTVLLNGSPRTFDDMCNAIEEFETTELEKDESPLKDIVAALRSVDEEPDWGNTKEREGVCWRCGCAGHQARFCVRDMPSEAKKKVLRLAQQSKKDRASSAPVPSASAPTKKEHAHAADTYTSSESANLVRAMGAVDIDATTPAGMSVLRHWAETGERANFTVRGFNAEELNPWADPLRSPCDEPFSPSSPSLNFAGACLTSTPARKASRSRSRGRNCRGGRRSDLRRSPSRHMANALAGSPDADDDDLLEEDPNESYWRSYGEDDEGGNDSDYSL